MARPLISIITVTYNAVSTLEATIKSVIKQKTDLAEYIVIDGGSTDGTLSLLEKYGDNIDWTSEPDKGIYDAMNKGVDRARGEWLYFLGGDDVLEKDILDKIEKYLDKKFLIVFGDVMFDNDYVMKSFLGVRTLFQNTIHHQSAFYNKCIFSNYRYNSSYSIAAEYDIHINVFVKKFRTLYVPIVIARCALGGASSDLSVSLKETNDIRSKYLNAKKNKLLSILLRIYYFQKKVRYKLYGHRV